MGLLAHALAARQQRCTDALAALSAVRIQAVTQPEPHRCFHSTFGTDAQAGNSGPGNSAGKGRCPLGVCSWASWGCSSEGTVGSGCRQRAALGPPGCQLFLSPLVLCTCCTQTHPQSQGDKTCVCNPGRRRRHGLGSSGVLAASEGPRRPEAGRRWCRGKRLLVAKTRKELEDLIHANPRACSSLPPAVRSQDSGVSRACTSSFQLRY